MTASIGLVVMGAGMGAFWLLFQLATLAGL